MYANVRLRSAIFQPTAAGTDQTKALFPMVKGERVLWASAQVLTPADASSTMTLTLGDDTDPDGLIAAFDPETTAGTLFNGAGAYLATSGGKLYNAADTVDVVYDQTTYAGVNIKVRFVIATVREYPNS